MNATPDTPLITIDFGNTRLKCTLICNRCLKASFVGEYEEALACIRDWVDDYGASEAVVSGSGQIADDIELRLKKCGIRNSLVITSATPVPIWVDYPRENLGLDRLAAAVGVADGKKKILIVDAGTALTLDLVAGNQYLGGNISAGLKMRFKALNENCIHLPLITPSIEAPLIGKNTKDAICAGVTRGFINEIIGHYNDVKKEYGDTEIRLTGGDSEIVGQYLHKAHIPFREDKHLVALGMSRIYYYNDNNKDYE